MLIQHEIKLPGGERGNHFHTVRGVYAADTGRTSAPDIVTGTYSYMGAMTVYDSKKFTIKRKMQNGEFFISAVAVGDPDGDGDIEIIFVRDNYKELPKLFVINGETLSVEWESEPLPSDIASIEVHDVDGDGTDEIVAGSFFHGDKKRSRSDEVNLSKDDGKSHGVSTRAEKSRWWEFGRRRGVGGIARAPEGYVYVFDGKTHALKWKSPNMGGAIAQLALADTDGDGNTDILVARHGGKNDIFIFDGVSHELKGKVRGNLGIAANDIDGDGTMEILAGSAYDGLSVYDGKTYEVKWTALHGDRKTGWIENILVDDLDADGTKEIVFGLLQGRRPTGRLMRFVKSVFYLLQGDRIHWLPAGGTGYVYVLDGITHEIKWKSGPLENFTQVYDAYDIDGDGVKEILAGGETLAYILSLPGRQGNR